MADLIEEIKTRLGITGNYHDALLGAYAEDVKDFMVSGGISDDVLYSDKAVGLISRGVADLWNFGSGDGKFSDMFYQRMTQLVLMSEASGETSGAITFVPITKSEIDECTECLDD